MAQTRHLVSLEDTVSCLTWIAGGFQHRISQSGGSQQWWCHRQLPSSKACPESPPPHPPWLLAQGLPREAFIQGLHNPAGCLGHCLPWHFPPTRAGHETPRCTQGSRTLLRVNASLVRYHRAAPAPSEGLTSSSVETSTALLEFGLSRPRGLKYVVSTFHRPSDQPTIQEGGGVP
jgi:hypothetical protein